MPSKQLPPGWGDDELTKFLEATHHNQYATFVKKQDAVGTLVNIDAQFAKVTKGWLNPDSEIIAMLFIRSHGAYRTASGLAMAGQAAECYVQCRSVLEYASYAVHINKNPELAIVWLNRRRGQHESIEEGISTR